MMDYPLALARVVATKAANEDGSLFSFKESGSLKLLTGFAEFAYQKDLHPRQLNSLGTWAQW
jgi:hypothetical protein